MRNLLLLIFAIIFAGAVYLWQMPPVVALVYAAASIVCFGMYALDKAAAKAGRWRTPENILLFWGLACGWPGAIVAQKLMRHKSHKPSFRTRFLATVALNIGVFIYLVAPISPLHRL
ncbi:MAG: DUF1294 domain-containing protein [Bdellovibrionales bacterium]|nr:DUF1294 domain-containing protein [Massilia sp.]